MPVQRFFVRRFTAAFRGNFALIDAVHRHATDIVNGIDGAGQTGGGRIAGNVRGVAFFVVQRLRRCLRDIHR